MEDYNALPTTALGVLEQFQTSKEGIISFASKVICEVENGNADPLKVKIICKTLSEIADKIDQATKENQRNEAAKYGERPFMFMGAELHYTPVKTEYDYKVCGDSELDELLLAQESITKKIKARQEWLKTMGGPETIVSKSTGEIVTVFPPIKKSSMGVKVTIK